MNTTTTTTGPVGPVRERVMLLGLTPWERNPRGDHLRNIEAFAEVLGREGIREDLHVFRNNGVMTIMQGHRRREAGLLAGIAEVWVKNYGDLDEGAAFRILISLQNGSDPFDARELALAARTAVRLGMTSGEVAQVFHRSEETVQLYLDLETLPHRVQEAVYSGKLAMGIADLMRQLDSRAKQEEALGFLLHDRVTGEPMSEAQGRVFLNETYLVPQKREKKWLEMIPGLRRKFPEAQVVAWEDREDYVMSDVMPMAGFARAEEYIDGSELVKPAEPLTWGGLAEVYGVPLFVAPTLGAESKHALLVPMKPVRDADATSEEPRLGRRKDWPKKTKEDKEGALDDAGAVDEITDAAQRVPTDEEEAAPFDVERWRKVVAVLRSKPEAVMADRLWKPLVVMQWEALSRVLPADVYASAMGEMNRDEGQNRRGLRWCFLALMALAHENLRNGEMQEEIAEVEGALGIEGENAKDQAQPDNQNQPSKT